MDYSTATALRLCPHDQLLEVTWQQALSSPELRASYNNVLTQMAERPVARLLLDVQNRGASSCPADQAWIAREFLPSLLLHTACVPLRVAYVLPHTQYQELLADAPSEQLVNCSELLLLHYFSDRFAAMAWLCRQD